MQKFLQASLFAALFLSITSCQLPITNIAGAAVGIYELSQKRERWLDQAQKGDVYAQYELAESLCCRSSEGKTNMAESHKWFCYAAMNGNAKAQVKMAQVYEGLSNFGHAPSQPNITTAYQWYSFAARRANEAGLAGKRRTMQRLTPDARQSATAAQLTPRTMNCLPQ